MQLHPSNLHNSIHVLNESHFKTIGMNHGKVFKLLHQCIREVKIVFEGSEKYIEEVLRHASADALFQEPLFGDSMGFGRENNGFYRTSIDFLVETMDWEIFADFRKKLDSQLTKNSFFDLFRIY